MRRDPEGRPRRRDRPQRKPLTPRERERVEDLVEEEIQREGFMADALQVSKDHRIRVVLDVPDGTVTLKNCVFINHRIQHALQDAGYDPGDFNIEVDSPGIDRPLRTQDHYRRFTGSRVKVRLSRPVADRQVWIGALSGIEGETVTLDPEEGEPITFELQDVSSCHLHPKMPF